MYACRPSLGALSLFPVTHPAVVAVPFTRPPPPPTAAHHCCGMHCTCVLCVCQRLPRVWHGCVGCVRCEWV